jgi:Ribbon-helix-helix protein, copG family
MALLQLASTKIPPELVERLKKFTESTRSTQSAVIRRAIEQFLDNAESTGLSGLTNAEGSLKPSPLGSRVDAVDSRLTDIEERLMALEGRSAERPSPPIAAAAVTTSPPKPKREPSSGMLGTTEAWEQLKAIGYSKSLPTFRRHLAVAIDAGELPADLVALGLVADFEIRRSANPKDNSVRWLTVDPVC